MSFLSVSGGNLSGPHCLWVLGALAAAGRSDLCAVPHCRAQLCSVCSRIHVILVSDSWAHPGAGLLTSWKRGLQSPPPPRRALLAGTSSLLEATPSLSKFHSPLRSPGSLLRATVDLSVLPREQMPNFPCLEKGLSS